MREGPNFGDEVVVVGKKRDRFFVDNKVACSAEDWDFVNCVGF